ncbi:YceI family protein [Nocardiopsis sp. NPDC050513]|uniref:YceI family protein n=1 Tax=Nocardiopsis sp. NPDC050513 TaxID=3364338 RepID=UPI0037A9C3FB
MAATGTATPLSPGIWTIDAAHSLVGFSVRHMTVARVHGRFLAFDGRVTVPPDDPFGATVSTAVDVASVSSGHPMRDDLIRSPDFLDAAAHPVMAFASRPVELVGGDRFRVPGDLTIRGATRPVVLDAVFGGQVEHRGAVRAGFSATAVIRRREFGVTWSGVMDTGGAVVSDEVRITLEVELVRMEGAA